MTRQRLQKLIAAAGLCSRRRAEQWLQEGRVTVDQRVAHLGDQADPDLETIRVDGRLLNISDQRRVLLLNKPIGVICSCHDPQGRTTVMDLLPASQRNGLHPVGRLDADSRGALLLTDAGALTLKLTHPRYDHIKTYRVWVQGRPQQTTLERWRQGLWLDGRQTRPATVQLLRQQGPCSLLEVMLKEGRNRQIRRVAEVLGHPVLDLQRIAIADLQLGDLVEGCWRQLSTTEWAPLLDGDAPRTQRQRPCD
ncbi:MAG: pseudouridine synthase [Cyanobium sp. NAT70]|nr:pseudouridine synthase [Cyanobium sp. NAT70]